ncbi:MAG TPA: thioesterase domain-containing protein, partial [Thermoanaerobaculia bacterium]|nr:thioesterase domain-containing protein [Thermoanaerobaculia bacterium]
MQTIPPNQRWLAYREPNPRARLRVFCFPYAGGGAPAFRAWSHLLPPTVELRVVQLPGRGPRLREVCFERMPPLAAAVDQALESLSVRPLFLFGHSLGAL